MVVITRTSGSHEKWEPPNTGSFVFSWVLPFCSLFSPFFFWVLWFIYDWHGRVSSSLPNTQCASKANVALFTIHPLLWSSYTYTCTLYIYVDTCMHMWSLMSRWRHHNILLATSYDGCKKGQLDKEEKKERNDWSMQQLVQSRSKKHWLLGSREQHAWVSRDLIFSPGWDIEESSMIWTRDRFELWRLPRENVSFWRNFWTICSRRCQCALLIRQRTKYNEQAVFDVSLAIYNLVVSSQ